MSLDGPKLETYLDSLETQEPRLLFLQPLEYLIRVLAIHVRFLHQWERNTVIKLAERRDLLVRGRARLERCPARQTPEQMLFEEVCEVLRKRFRQ